MNLKQLIEEAYLDMGADLQEGGGGNKPEWLSEIESFVAALRMAEMSLTMPILGQKVRALRNGNDDAVVAAIRTALAKVDA